MLTKRDVFRYGKWLDSLSEKDYELLAKVSFEETRKFGQEQLLAGMFLGALIILLGILVYAVAWCL